MRSTSMFPCIMAMISNFTIFFIFQIFIFKVFFTNITIFCIFKYYSCFFFVCSFIFFFLKLIICIACSLKDSANFFIQFLPPCTSCLFFMLLNKDIVDIKKPDGICSLTFVVDEFSGLFLHQSIFSIILSRFA